MQSQRLHRCTVYQLRKIAKIQGISKCERLKRHELLKILQHQEFINVQLRCQSPKTINVQRRHVLVRECRQNRANKAVLNAVIRIQKWYRYWKSIRELEDPITLDNIEGQPFVHVSKTSPYSTFTFGAPALSKFVIDSLNFYNPMTREQLNEIEVRRLDKLSGNRNTLFSYYNRDKLNEEREKCEIAIKSFQWDIEESIEDALEDGLRISDQYGTADTNDVYDLIHDFQSTVVPDVLISLRKIQEYEKLPRVDRGTSTTLADNMVTLIERHNPTTSHNAEDLIDIRILNFLKSIFHRFVEQSTNFGSSSNNNSHGLVSTIMPALSSSVPQMSFRFTNYLLNESPNTPYVTMQADVADVTNPLSSALIAFFAQGNQ